MIRTQDALLLVVDVQDGFSSYKCFDDVVLQAGKLVQGAGILELPLIVTEQYPKGLSPTAAAVGLPEDVVPIEKTVFSACRADGFNLHGRRQIILCGIEAHVCVAQTAMDLLQQGAEVYVIADAVGSRHKRDYKVSLQRLAQAGCTVTTVEAILLELCERAGTPEFKAVQRIIL